MKWNVHAVKQYQIKAGLFDRPRKLILANDFVEWEDSDVRGHEFSRIQKSDIVDFKHGTDWIVWFEFTIGRKFSVTIKDRNNKELRIHFASYFGQQTEKNQMYANIVSDVWGLYHSGIVDGILNHFYENGEVDIAGVRVTGQGIEFGENKRHVPWGKVTMKAYHRYFAIFHKDNPDFHVSIAYNQYGTEALWSVVNAIQTSINGTGDRTLYSR